MQLDNTALSRYPSVTEEKDAEHWLTRYPCSTRPDWILVHLYATSYISALYLRCRLSTLLSIEFDNRDWLGRMTLMAKHGTSDALHSSISRIQFQLVTFTSACWSHGKESHAKAALTSSVQIQSGQETVELSFVPWRTNDPFMRSDMSSRFHLDSHVWQLRLQATHRKPQGHYFWRDRERRDLMDLRSVIVHCCNKRQCASTVSISLRQSRP